MKVLDLCSGTGSATKAFIDRGHDVETLDISGINTYIMDVRDFFVLKKYDFVWASPPCTCFSIAAVGYHWIKHVPKPETLEAIDILNSIISIATKANYFCIENPMGMMRTLPVMKDLRKKYYRTTVTYCQYGDTAMKPTDLWHNIPSFIGRRCKNGDACHTPSPRSSHNPGSTQGKQNLNDRYKVPYRLSLNICKALENV